MGLTRCALELRVLVPLCFMHAVGKTQTPCTPITDSAKRSADPLERNVSRAGRKEVAQERVGSGILLCAVVQIGACVVVSNTAHEWIRGERYPNCLSDSAQSTDLMNRVVFQFLVRSIAKRLNTRGHGCSDDLVSSGCGSGCSLCS